MKKLLMIYLLSAAVSMVQGAVAGDVNGGNSPEDIVREIERKLSPTDYTALFYFKNNRTDGTISTYEVKFQNRDINHVYGLFIKPEREKGREVLRINDALWTYMPSVGRTMRIADRDSFAGGDFSNADILRPDWSNNYDVKLAKETGKQWILDMVAKTTNASYAKMRLWVSKKQRQPIQLYFYDSKGTLLKRCRYGAVTAFGNVIRPAKMKMDNLLTTQSTYVEIKRLTPGMKFKDARFAVGNLGK